MVLASKESINEVWLTTEQKWMRWALNKFFYTQRQNSLRTAFLYLLKEKYTDENGLLKKDHPSFYQFRYFYRKTRNEQNFLISRKGLTEYQRNYRPLLGDGIAEFSNHVGVAMLDSTICDIYLVDEKGTLFGRPILTACVDAYSQMSCGFALTWQGGMDSLRALMENVIVKKVEYCKQYGVLIKQDEWDCNQLPGVMVTDRGMLENQVKPYPFELWNYGKGFQGANLISVDSEMLRKTLLPRTTGTFSRKGLSANGLRYKREEFTERYLKGGSCVVSYVPDNVSKVWLSEGDTT